MMTLRKRALAFLAMFLLLLGGASAISQTAFAAAPSPVAAVAKVGTFSCTTSGAGQVCFTDNCDEGLGCNTFQQVVGGNAPLHRCVPVTAPLVSAIRNQTGTYWQLYRTSTCGGSTIRINSHALLISYPGFTNWPSGWDNAVHGAARY